MSETNSDLDNLVRHYVYNLKDDGTPWVSPNPYPYIPVELVMEACPFCGGDPSNFWDDSDEGEEPRWVVTCGDCAADGPPGSTLTEAFNAWNGRS